MTTVLVLGGARSGKSRYAERLLLAHEDVTYVAPGTTRPDDADWAARIEVHRERRPATWQTHESADVAGEIAASHRIQTVDKALLGLNLLGGLNLFLFAFNMVPLLPLDGGHIVGALWEGVKRTAARVAGRPDPGYVDVAKALPLTYAVSLVLIAMSVLLIYADLVKPVRL